MVKQKKTFKNIRMSSAEVNKEIKDTEKEKDLLHRHFHLMQIRKRIRLMTRGIENLNDELG